MLMNISLHRRCKESSGSQRDWLGRIARVVGIPLASVSLGWPLLSANAQVSNLAIRKPAYATSSYGIYVPSRGNDGDPGSIWNGGGHQACWMVDLQGTYAVQAVQVSSNQFGDSGLQTVFQLSASLDNARWWPLGPAYVGRGDQTFQIGAGGTPMRFVRYCTLPGSTQWATLGEFKVYGSAASGTSPNPGNRNGGPPDCDPSKNSRSPFDERNCYPGGFKTVPSSTGTPIIPGAPIQSTP